MSNRRCFSSLAPKIFTGYLRLPIDLLACLVNILSLQRLHTQCNNLSITTLPPSPPSKEDLKSSYDVILDAIFGFSFHPPVRPPFDVVLPLLASSGLPIVSVDIPSGWDVEKGPVELTTKVGDADEKLGEVDGVDREKPFKWLEPDVLISLTAPKEGVRPFTGRHFLGGRFIPWFVHASVFPTVVPQIDLFCREMQKKYELNLPNYFGSEQIVELPRLSEQKL